MSKINIFISILIVFTAIGFILFELSKSESIWLSSIIYSITILIIGEFIAFTTALNIQNRIYYRTLKEVAQNALPEVPFKIQKALKFIPINLALLTITSFLSYFYLDDPLKSSWYFILLIPMFAHAIGLIIYFIFLDNESIEQKKIKLANDDRYLTIIAIGKKLSNKESKSCRKTNTNEYKTILYYLKNGLNPDEVFENRYTLLLPSSCCGDEKLVKSLIEHGSNVNFKSSLGKTALILASTHGFKEIVLLLVENGADIKEKDFDGHNALFYAKQNKHQEVINILKKKD